MDAIARRFRGPQSRPRSFRAGASNHFDSSFGLGLQGKCPGPASTPQAQRGEIDAAARSTIKQEEGNFSRNWPPKKPAPRPQASAVGSEIGFF